MAGLERLGRRGEATEILEPDLFLPAPGQGAIALECREDDGAVAAAVSPLHHEESGRAVAAERALLAGLHGGCNVPLGAYAVGEDGTVRLTAFVARPDGSGLLRGQARDPDPLRAGAALAEQLLARGAGELMRG
jgi:hydroxymethylbilane synthase